MIGSVLIDEFDKRVEAGTVSKNINKKMAERGDQLFSKHGFKDGGVGIIEEAEEGSSPKRKLDLNCNESESRQSSLSGDISYFKVRMSEEEQSNSGHQKKKSVDGSTIASLPRNRSIGSFVGA